MPRLEHTFCRICEPYCPLVAELDDADKVVALHPNPDHPSGGVACHKGLSYLEIHNDPDRVNWPLRRVNPRSESRGEFVETGWDSAMTDLGDRLRTILDESGPNAIAVYFGNPWGLSGPSGAASVDFQDQLGTQMRFHASTQDVSNKFTVAGAVYGTPGALLMPDLYNTDYLLCLGANPKVSRWTLVSMPNDGLDVVKRIQQKGGKVRFVNPRKIESSTNETGPTTLIKPGADVYFLAALLHEIHALGAFDTDLLTRYGKRVDDMIAFVQRYPADAVADVTGIDADTIREIAAELVAAPSASIYMSTGLNQSRQGVLAYWLIQMICFATGNLGRKGGLYKGTGLFDYLPPETGAVQVDTSIGSFRLPDPIGYAGMPATVLPDLIEAGDIRALIVLGGNPLLSMAGEERLRSAFERLDLLATVDIYRSATGELADYVLPATDWIERMDVNFFGAMGLQPIPYVQYADALEPPAYGRKSGWWIISRIAQAMGVPSALDALPDHEDGTALIDGLLSIRGLSIEKMRTLPHQTAMIEQEDYAVLFERCLQYPDKRIDCCPPAFVEAGLFERCDEIFAELQAEAADSLKLISLRTTHMHNSWFANADKFRRGKERINPLHMTESDAGRRALFEGDVVRVHNAFGSVETRVQINNDLRDGVVAMSHGYGQRRSHGLRTASGLPGVNYNALMPTGDCYEPLSHMSWLTAVPVTVERVVAPADVDAGSSDLLAESVHAPV